MVNLISAAMADMGLKYVIEWKTQPNWNHNIYDYVIANLQLPKYWDILRTIGYS